jgi:glutaminyl-tRNA synthetase
VTENGEVVELRCHHVPDSVGKNPPGIKVAGVIHWVPATGSLSAEVRLYDRLFLAARPEDPGNELNPDSVEVITGARLEASLANAEVGSRWQLERVGYFVFDPVDSRHDAPVLNRIVTLRDSWQGRPQPTVPASDPKAPKTSTRPPKRSRIEYRAEARVRDPVLAERFATWSSIYGLPDGEVDLLTGDRSSGDLFEAAVAAGASAAAVARWMINELPHELDDHPLDESPLTGRGLGRLVLAAELGEVTGAAAKEVLAELVQRGGDPAQIIAQRGLAQISDEAAIAEIIDQVLAAHQDKVDQYRNGKTGLFGFFIGQVVRLSQGKAKPEVIRQLLGARLD